MWLWLVQSSNLLKVSNCWVHRCAYEAPEPPRQKLVLLCCLSLFLSGGFCGYMFAKSVCDVAFHGDVRTETA